MTLQHPPNDPRRSGDIVPLRIERGAEVLCTDGVLGTVEQVVMDEQTSELRAIVVRPLNTMQELVIDIAHVVRAGDNQVHLNFSQRAMRSDPTLAQPYNPAGYIAVPPTAGVPPQQAARIAGTADQPVVTGLERDAVELMAPAHEVQPGQPGRPSPDTRLTADWHKPGNIASVSPQQMGPRETEAALQQSREAAASDAAAPSVGSKRSSKQEKSSMPKFNDRSLETPQALSAQQEAQQIRRNPDSVAPLEGTAVAGAQPSPRPAWLTPVVIGAGALTLVGGVTLGALLWQRRSQPTGLDWWRMQLRQLTRDPQKASRTLARTVAKNVADAAPDLTDLGNLASDQLDAWRTMLGDQIDAWRDTVGEQAVSNLKQVSKITSKNAAKGIAGWAATLGAMATLASDQLDDWRETLGDQLDAWRYAVSGALSDNSKALSKSLSTSAKSATRAPRRVVKRGMVGMRWFRRGIALGGVGGAIVGLLVAPVSGSQLRAQIGGFIQQITGRVQSAVSSATSNQPRISSGRATTTGTTTPPTGGTLSETGPIR